MNPDMPQDAADGTPTAISTGSSGSSELYNEGASNANSASAGRSCLWISALIIVCATGIDQLTKFWAVRELSGQEPLQALGEFLRFTLVYNEGGAMGTNFGGALYYLIIGIAIFLVIIYYLWIYRYSLRYSIPLSLIASGAVGNLIDRIRLGKVVDWIDVDFFNIDLFGYQLERWWTFNVADASITLALMYMVWAVFSSPRASGIAKTGDSAHIEFGDTATDSNPGGADVSGIDPVESQEP